MKKKMMLLASIITLLLAACNIQTQTPVPAPDTPIETQANAWYMLGHKLNMSSSSSASLPSVAVSSKNTIMAAWGEYAPDTRGDVYVKRWDGNFWVTVGSALDVDATWSAENPSIALDSSENPVVAWHESSGVGESYIYVKYWNGSSWVRLGTALDVNFGWSSYNSSLALDKMNRPVVAFYEQQVSGPLSRVYVKRWNGTAWVQLGSALNVQSTERAFEPSLALDASGNPVVAWSEERGETFNTYVKRWDGGKWVSLGGALDIFADTDSRGPSLKLDSSNNPIVAWEEGNLSGSNNVYVKRWNGTSWLAVGSGVSSKIADDPSLYLDSANTPVVAMEEYDGSNANISVKKWNGSSWVTLVSTLDVKPTEGAYSPALVLDNSGNPVVGWWELGSTDNKGSVYVKRYISNGWQALGKTLDITPTNDATFSSIARKSNDRPVVTWQEFGNIYVKEWTGTTWTKLGNKLNTIAGNNPVIAMRSDDKPVVAWKERTDPFSQTDDIRIKYWNGTNWQAQGSIRMPSFHSFALAIGSSNNPIIAYSTFGEFGEGTNLYIKRWNGTAWVGMNCSPTVTPLDINGALEAGTPSLTVDSTGKPTIAWVEGSGFGSSIYVKRWTGTAWVQLGANLENAPANHPSIDMDSTGKPVVAWEERVFDGATTQTNISVKRWNGTTWVSFGSGQPVDKFVGSHAFDPVLQLRSDDLPVIVMTQFVLRDGMNTHDIYIRRWNANQNQWVNFGVPVDKNIAFDAKNPSFVLRTNNNPIVSWDEDDGVSRNVYVSQF
jgi:hypothetical protein